MWERYFVSHIYEDDFGCEERSVDHEPQVLVELKTDDGMEMVLRQADAWLYTQDINEGDFVVLEDGKLKKYSLQPEIDRL